MTAVVEGCSFSKKASTIIIRSKFNYETLNKLLKTKWVPEFRYLHVTSDFLTKKLSKSVYYKVDDDINDIDSDILITSFNNVNIKLFIKALKMNFTVILMVGMFTNIKEYLP